MICTDVAFAWDPIKFPDMFTGSYIYENHIFKPSQGRISLRQFGEVVCQGKGDDRHLKRKIVWNERDIGSPIKMFRQGPQSKV